MKTSFIYAPTDYFTRCPYCQAEHDTNIDGEVIKCGCGKRFKAVFDQREFAATASNSIYSVKEIEDHKN